MPVAMTSRERRAMKRATMPRSSSDTDHQPPAPPTDSAPLPNDLTTGVVDLSAPQTRPIRGLKDAWENKEAEAAAAHRMLGQNPATALMNWKQANLSPVCWESLKQMTTERGIKRIWAAASPWMGIPEPTRLPDAVTNRVTADALRWMNQDNNSPILDQAIKAALALNLAAERHSEKRFAYAVVGMMLMRALMDVGAQIADETADRMAMGAA